jgi:tRNA(adenine34) deaminase
MDTKSIVAAEMDELFMRTALEEARKAGEREEVPVGAVIIDEQQNILAVGSNNSIGESDPAGHAEMVAMRTAGKNIGNYRLLNTTIYVTIEPCVMCAGAMIHARVGRLVYGAPDPKTGGVVSCYQVGGDGKLNHQLNIEGGVLAEECAELLTSFFRKKRVKL